MKRLIRHILFVAFFFVYLLLLKVDFGSRVTLLAVILPWVVMIVFDLLLIYKEGKQK